MNGNDAIALGIFCVFMVSIIPIVGGLMYARRERLLVHAERMKAMEMGMEWPDGAAQPRKRNASAALVAKDGQPESLAPKCFSTALWVAFWGFAAAAGLGGAEVSSGVAYAIASSAGAIGVTSVICGTVLASRASAVEQANRYAKRADVDADEFDVVSSRA